MSGVSDVMSRFTTYLINPAIVVVFAAGFLIFIYGLVEFLWNLNEGGENKEGKQHMIWGIVGMLIMVSVYGILSLVTNTFGISIDNPNYNTNPDINIGASF